MVHFDTIELSREYERLNRLAGQTENELDHKTLMARIDLVELYWNFYCIMDSVVIYDKHGKTHIMDHNQP